MEKKGETQNQYVKWLFSHVLNHKGLFTLNFIGIIMVTYTRTIIPVRIGRLTDQIATKQVSGNLLLAMTILLGFYLLRNAVEYITWMIGHKLGSKTEQSMRRQFFENVQNKPLSFHDSTKTGDLQALATNDLRVINTMIAHGSFYIYPFIQTIVTLVQIQTFNYLMALLTLPFLGLYTYFVLRYRKHLTPYSKKALTKHADITVSLQESLNGIQVTRAFCAEDLEYEKFRKTVQAYRKNRLGEIRVQARFYPLLVLYIAIGLSIVLGVFFVPEILSLGELTAVLLLLIALIHPTTMIFWATRDMIGGFAASERLFDTISSGDVELLPKQKQSYSDVFEGEIAFQNVSFSYPNSSNGNNNPKVLKDLSFKIAPNQRVALVGPTGCGKTTLAKLLLRLYDAQEGTIFLDGKQIQDYPLEMVRQQIALIEQDIFLFSQTIEENIKFGSPNESKDRVIEAAKLAHAHDFITNFDKGYDTVVGERGTTLSGGEKQRIAIARAFIVNPDILILDDSMSAIDSETEEKIAKAINNILKNRTTVIITHRLHTIRTSDLILVMKNGEIVAQGQHEKLLSTSKDYRKIFGMHLEDTNLGLKQEVN